MEKYCVTRQATGNSIIQHMLSVRWMTVATDTHSENVIPIAFPWQKWLCERLYQRCLPCYGTGSVFLRVYFPFPPQCFY